MTNTKINNLVENVNAIVENDGIDNIKSYIGDSVSNNRTVSVRQLIRYFVATREVHLAKNLEMAYSLLRNKIKRRRSSARTDAIDLSEFTQTSRNLDTKTKRRLGQLLDVTQE